MKIGNGLLESDSMLIVARNIASTARSGTVFIKCLVHFVEDLFVFTHSEIVIGAPDSDPFFLVGHVGSWELLCQPVNVVEVTVRLVLVFLVKLGIVEGVVIEFGNVRSRGFRARNGIVGLDVARARLLGEDCR